MKETEELLNVIEFYEKYGEQDQEQDAGDNPFVVLGPDGAKKTKLRLYVYGGCAGYFSTNNCPSNLCNETYSVYLKKKYVNKKKPPQSFSIPSWILEKEEYKMHIDEEGGLEKSFKSLVNRTDNSATKDYHRKQTADDILRTEQYRDYVMAAFQNRWKKDDNTLSERRIQTKLIKQFRGKRPSESPTIITDMEYSIAMPETGIVRMEDADKTRTIRKKPDIIVFDEKTKSFGLIELKYNGESLENLEQHYLDFCNLISKAGDPIRKLEDRWAKGKRKSDKGIKEAIEYAQWTVLDECLYRARFQCDVGLIHKEWKSYFNTIRNDFKNQLECKKGEFPDSLLWCGFYFVGGDLQTISAALTNDRLKEDIKNSQISARYAYCTNEEFNNKSVSLTFNYDYNQFMQFIYERIKKK